MVNKLYEKYLYFLSFFGPYLTMGKRLRAILQFFYIYPLLAIFALQLVAQQFNELCI